MQTKANLRGKPVWACLSLQRDFVVFGRVGLGTLAIGLLASSPGAVRHATRLVINALALHPNPINDATLADGQVRPKLLRKRVLKGLAQLGKTSPH